MKTVIVDLDDTLFDASHRKKYVEVKSGKPDFDKFNEMSVHDTPNNAVVKKVLDWQDQGNDIVVFSGRSENMKPDTLSQLSNLNIKPSVIKMRGMEDRTSSVKLKEKWLHELKKEDPHREFVAAIDDHSGNVRMFKKNGIHTYKVTDGNIEVNKYLEKVAKTLDEIQDDRRTSKRRNEYIPGAAAGLGAGGYLAYEAAKKTGKTDLHVLPGSTVANVKTKRTPVRGYKEMMRNPESLKKKLIIAAGIGAAGASAGKYIQRIRDHGIEEKYRKQRTERRKELRDIRAKRGS